MGTIELANTLRVYKTHPDVKLPKHSTDGAACFDLAYDPSGKDTYTVYHKSNQQSIKYFHDAKKEIYIVPGDRIMVPTGLIFDIPKGYSVRVYARSGLALKKGLILIHSIGVVDYDYFHECHILLANVADHGQTILPGDRLAQAEMVKSHEYSIVEIDTPPMQKTDRIGGYGSTGVVSGV